MTADSFASNGQQGRLFDRIPALYRNARPGYPDEVFTLLTDCCGLKAGSSVLEIGAGAGQATLPILHLGAHVTAVEPGVALSGVLSERAVGFPLRIITTTFEEAAITNEAFDLVVAATSFHWVDAQIGLPKIAGALRKQGWLALWWTVFGDPNRPDPFNDALQPILSQLAPTLLHDAPVRLPDGTERARSVRDIKASGLFAEVHQHVISWEGRHDPAQIRALFSTFSPWLALPDQQRTETLDALERLAQEKFGGVVVRPYQTFVYLTQRILD